MTRIQDRIANEDLTITDAAKVEEKVCKHCGETKSAAEFGLRVKTGTNKVYIHAWCIECRRARSAQQKQERRAKLRCLGMGYSRWKKCLVCEDANECAEEWYRTVQH